MQGVIAVSKTSGISNSASGVIGFGKTSGFSDPASVVIAGCRLSASGSDARLHVSCGLNDPGFRKVSFKVRSSIFFPNNRGKPLPPFGANSRKRNVLARADGNQDKTSGRIAPLELESPTGQFLSQILRSHPHLLPAAIEQQLETLAADRDAASEQEPPSTSGTEIVLY
ncbi:hypothetical protein KI387_009465, partial [Taxus chinensis]